MKMLPRITSPFQILNPVTLFIAFILLFFVSLSLPIIKPIYLFQIQGKLLPGQPQTSTANKIRAGLWGYCGSGYEFNNGVQTYVENYFCTPPELGYKFDPIILELVNKSAFALPGDIALASLPVVLVVHPIATGLTFLALIPNVVRLFKTPIPEDVQIVDLVVEIIPTIVATFVFFLDIALVLVAKHELNSTFEGSVTIGWGPAVWMTFVAMLCLWVGLVGLSAYACGCCGLSKQTVRFRMAKRFVYITEKEKIIDAETA